ncbi:MAG: ABC transporter ATP-binding protein [Chloroflexales bacterium]|nr:ABC transporter ATP-binding protein [Chloroflexales bacterium]
MQHVIHVDNLRKAYSSTIAVDSVSFDVGRGEIFGIVGPNGAGKTTTVECITGMRRPDNGAVQVLGLDPQRQERDLRERIGVQLQQAALPDRITVWEALDLFATFYARAVDPRTLLEQWGLTEKRNTPFVSLSGGQKQRLFIALALINQPEITFLDELTTGLDPQARRATWDLIREVRERGTTVVLVTHFMAEAEQLCDQVAIINAGRVVALDTPANLIRRVQGPSRVRFSAENGFDPAFLADLPEISRVTREGAEVVVYGDDSLLARVVAALAQHNLSPRDLRTEQPTLEDVFLALTGRKIQD